MLTVRVGASFNSGSPTGGRWLHGLVPFGNLSFSTAMQRPTDSTGGGGLHTMSWDLALPGDLPLPTELRWDSLVELFAGPVCLGAGVIAETPRGNSVTVDGLFRLGEDFYAVDASYLPTTDLSVAIPQAISRGLRWADPGDLPVGSLSTLSEDAAKFNTVAGLANAYCKANNKLWYIDRTHTFRIIDPPSTATQDWSLSPLVPNPQRAEDGFVSRYFIRRVDGVDVDNQPNAWAANTAVDAGAPAIREAAEDLESLGYMNSAAGDAKAAALLEANKSRSAFTEGVEVARGLLTTLGGTAPELWAVAAGEVVRQSNWLSASGDLVLGDSQAWVIGSTEWRQGEELSISPMGLAPRTAGAVAQARGVRSERLPFS